MAAISSTLEGCNTQVPTRWLDFTEHANWGDALAAVAGTKGVADICFSSDGRARLKVRGSYSRPRLNDALTSPGGWSSLCELIHPSCPEMLPNEMVREGGQDVGGFRFRVSRVRHRYGEEFTLRILPSSIPRPASIYLPDDLVNRFVTLREGLVVFAGSTGNGKSTSIAALIGENARRKDVRVVTIEDPVEYLHEDLPNGSTFTYREIGAHTKSFASALREAMRMHPDIIVVGEIRDAEAAEVALEASLTGHKVVSTIHGGNVEQAMQRLGDLASDIGISGVGALAQAFQICVAQRLVSSNGPGSTLVALHEILTWNEAVASKIRNGQFYKLKQDMESGSKHGMQTFNQSMNSRFAAGLVVR